MKNDKFRKGIPILLFQDKWFISKQDIFILNVGIHGSVKERKDTIEKLANNHVILEENMKIIYRSASTSHYESSDGVYDKKLGSALKHCSLKINEDVNKVDKLYLIEKSLFKNHNLIKFFDIFDLTKQHPSLHVGQGINVADCVHWCMPGMPDVWNDLFISTNFSFFSKN